MSETPQRPFLRIELDPATFTTHITGVTVNATMELFLALVLYENIRARFKASQAPKSGGVLPAHFVPPFKARPE
jgi:hypothetical protein